MRNRLAMMCTFLSLVSAPLCHRVLGAVEGDAELLRLVANTWTVNRESIRTWTGDSLVVVDSQTGDKSIHWTYSAHYVCDQKIRAKRWRCQYEAYRTVEGDKIQETSPDSYFMRIVNGMYKDDLFYRYYRPRSYSGRRQASIQNASVARVHSMADDFDPFFYLTRDGLGVDRDVMNYYDLRDDPELDVRVTREGDIVTVDDSQPDNVSYRKYDLSKGGNIVESRTAITEGAMTDVTECKITWRDANGIFVPDHMLRTQDVSDPDNPKLEMHIRREITFTATTINEPVDPAEFTLDAMGVKPGDMINDTCSDTSFIYKEEGKTPPPLAGDDLVALAAAALEVESVSTVSAGDTVASTSTLPPTGPKPADSSGARSWLVTIVVAVVALLVGAAWGLRKGKGGTGPSASQSH